jgi:tetratricopeptide (TPR) repeat protein
LIINPAVAGSQRVGIGSGIDEAEAVANGRKAARWTMIAAGAVALFALSIYLLVMGDTTPFWDAGEFIATSWILGIPHPPGTPLYVLLGRVASLVPFGTVAERVNGLSAVSGALAVFFTVLATARLARPLWATRSEVESILAGVVAGLFLAFSNTFWINAIEAEVYALSSMVMAIGLWATLCWRDAAERGEPGGDGRALLLVFYLLSLSIGIHLGTYLVLPGILVLVALERRHAILTSGDLLLWCVLGPAGVLAWWIGGGPFVWLFAIVAGGVLFIPTRRRAFVAALILLFALGLSVHLYLLIRSELDPAINEAAPKTWRALWDVLARKQYPPSNIFERKAPFLFQVDRLYLHYLREQFALAGGLGVLGRVLPLALGILGAVVHFARRKRDGVMMLTHFGIMSLGLILFLNLDGTFNRETQRWEIAEVRERDYFFAPSFQIFAMWIGIGMAALLADSMRSAGERRSRLFAVGAVAAVLFSLLPLRAGFATHDRRGNYVARDYGYNILNFVEPDAILFTNGDNDTFPLWYLQEVEGLRKDVRVVCLSLLNTGWYIKQLRDDAPRLPIEWTDSEIDSLKVALHPKDGLVTVHADGTYEPGTIKDAGVRHILRANEYRRPIYIAVTVPDRMGLDPQCSFEGMVFKVNREPPASRLDFDRALANAFNNYSYRGVLLPDNSRDTRVKVDETGEYLIHNYLIHWAELAFELERRGRSDEALVLLDRCKAIAPDRTEFEVLRGALFEDQGKSAAAESVFRGILERNPDDLDATYRLGVALLRQGRLKEARPHFEAAIRLSAGQFVEPTLWMARLDWEEGDPAAARLRVAAWLREHPDDVQTAQVLEDLSRGEDESLPR